jgi:hypothetical protein
VFRRRLPEPSPGSMRVFLVARTLLGRKLVFKFVQRRKRAASCNHPHWDKSIPGRRTLSHRGLHFRCTKSIGFALGAVTLLCPSNDSRRPQKPCRHSENMRIVEFQVQSLSGYRVLSPSGIWQHTRFRPIPIVNRVLLSPDQPRHGNSGFPNPVK